MGLFKKKFNEDKALDYLVHVFVSSISYNERQSHAKKLERLKAELPALANVALEVFEPNLVAANLVIARKTWSIFIFMNLGAGGMIDFKTEQLANSTQWNIPGIKRYRDLYDYYDVDAGPSGVPPLEEKIAGLFVENILPDDDKNDGVVLTELYNAFETLFHGSMKADLNHMQQSKIIS